MPVKVAERARLVWPRRVIFLYVITVVIATGGSLRRAAEASRVRAGHEASGFDEMTGRPVKLRAVFSVRLRVRMLVCVMALLLSVYVYVCVPLFMPVGYILW